MWVVDRVLLWPNRVPVKDVERAAAAERVTHEVSTGTLDAEQARVARARLAAARTHADLRAAVAGIPGAAGQPAMAAVVSVATALWVLSGVSCIVVWLAGGLSGAGWDWPWWIWPVGGGALAVAGLYRIMKMDHLMSLSVDSKGKGLSAR